MREIKFRAWDHKTKQMLPVWSIGWKAWEGKPENKSIINYVELVADIMDGAIKRLDGEVELMQFTGLHDKNGKEIYEGDILSCIERIKIGMDEPWKDKKTISEVKWTNDGYYLTFVRDKEIIGNIYENGELLNG